MPGSKSSSESRPLTPEEMKGYFDTVNSISGGRLNTFAKNGTASTPFNPVSADLSYTPVSANLNYSPVSADVGYRAVSDDRLRSLGGAGATRLTALQQGRRDALDQIAADPRLSVFQSQRSNQLTNRDFGERSDAINKEVEAGLTTAALNQAQYDQSGRLNQANFNAAQNLADMQGRALQANFLTDQNKFSQAGRVSQAGFNAAQNAQGYLANVANNQLTRDDLAALANIFFAAKANNSSSSETGVSPAFDILGKLGAAAIGKFG